MEDEVFSTVFKCLSFARLRMLVLPESERYRQVEGTDHWRRGDLDLGHCILDSHSLVPTETLSRNMV